jgi:hypothetical protein
MRQPAGSSPGGARQEAHRGAEGQCKDAAAHALGLPVVVCDPHLRMRGRVSLHHRKP